MGKCLCQPFLNSLYPPLLCSVCGKNRRQHSVILLINDRSKPLMCPVLIRFKVCQQHIFGHCFLSRLSLFSITCWVTKINEKFRLIEVSA